MSKIKTVFFCQVCGTQAAKWSGKCLNCGTWGSMVEERVSTGGAKSTSSTPSFVGSQKSVPQLLHTLQAEDYPRISTGDAELDRVLGGGIVRGMLVLVGGEPGIGKSTLLLQLALNLSEQKVLYVSGEESEHQIKMRAERLNIINEQCLVYSETCLEKILDQVDALRPDLLIVDSIQTLYTEKLESAAGTVSQVRECASILMRLAKETGIPIWLIGHITKDGSIAGPKVLEHTVDTVLYFEGDRHLSYRLLRTTKNRFGGTSELGIYEMLASGLQQVSNPSEILLSQREEGLSGIAIASTLEGSRPLFVEVQSLVSPAAYGTPQRSTTGFDPKRLNMLLAVLEKRVGYKFGQQDVFLNIAGGLRIEDPAVDLAVCMSLFSAVEDIRIPSTVAFCGEVGLGGEVRAVQKIEQRLAEAERLGFNSAFFSKFSIKDSTQKDLPNKMKKVAVSKITEVLDSFS